MRLAVGQYSSAGRKPLNQDCHGCRLPEEPSLSTKGVAMAIADGISSSQVSQVASQAAVSGFLHDYYCTSEAWSVKQSAVKVLSAINSWLFAQTRSSPYRFDKDKGYICTFSGMVFKSNTAHVFHAGDARVYRLVGKTLEPLTQDHRHVVSAETSYLNRALGIHPTIELDYLQLPLEPEDVFVLTTDGVHEWVTEKKMATLVRMHAEDLDWAARRIHDAALKAGSDDNLTIMIARLEQLPDPYLEEVAVQASQLPLPPALRPRMAFDGFALLRELSISSRSHVYLAQDQDTGEYRVIKAPSRELRDNRSYLEGLLTEEWIARRLDNAHILKAPKPSRARQFLYVLLEYVDGQTLDRWMVDNPSPGLDQVRDIVCQVAEGLRAMHRQEILHQDLRPKNLMIDRAGTVKIIDLGAARVAGLEEIRPPRSSQTIVGTARYTAPEYFTGELATERADIFSLGVITYQMLTGKLPYSDRLAATQSRAEQSKLQYQSLLLHRPDLPVWVDEAIKKAIRMDPLKRYQEVSEFAHDLQHPNREFVHQTRPPLIARDPLRFWQCVSFVLLVLLIVQSSR